MKHINKTDVRSNGMSLAKLALVAMLCLGTSASVLAQAMGGAQTLFISNEVSKDNMVTLRFNAPKATDVKVATQMTKGQQQMKKNEKGVWEVTFGPVKPDMYPYAFVVDGIQVADPGNSVVFPNEGFQNSVLEVPGSTPLVHAIKNVPHGILSYRYYTSQELGTRQVLVYTPPGYENNTSKKYPVLYLLHGSSDTEETWTKVGRANFILDNLISEGKALDMIVVMPYGRAYPTITKTGSLRDWPNLQEFKKDFFGNLMPFIEKNYRTKNDKDSRAIAGFSGGGGTSLYFGLNNQDKFSYVVGFAPGMLKNEFDRNNAGAFENPEKTNKQIKLFWIGVGTEDPTYGTIKNDYLPVLDAKKIKYETFISDGGHTWMNCKLYLSTVAQRLFK